ncbi:type II/III secretion system short domain-containing protein [Prosthecobacter debontii]|uniref:Type II/III secretion system short domain-containing protein n=1 Tax=Prosthecobacter debontii TaxID=48467 RepID=A0A1T4WYQ4_9BACT|nr:secretin N-terminal domain-containing protein [Prosthecobacter debontii]SKA82379.1 type II/III secretion system short domain-containing protein [Prosthecobacter debontii]
MSPISSRSLCLLGLGLSLVHGHAQDEPAAAPPAVTTPPESVEVSTRLSGLASLPTQPEEGYWIDNAPINEVFQYLARSSDLQYFYNNELNSPQYSVTGHLKLDDPRQQMEDLALANGLFVYQQRSTISLMTETQLARLPVDIMSYQLKYLRGAPLNRSAVGKSDSGGESEGGGGGSGGTVGSSDFEKLKAIIRPMLTPQIGQIEFEEKTNTLLVSDNSIKLERVRKLLDEIDKAKPQIMVNVRVLRIRRNQGRHVGVDWSRSLGEDGTSLTVTQNLNALFNLPNVSTLTKSGDVNNPLTEIEQTNTPGAGLVFGSVQVQAILRALEAADLVTQEACPTIITEDNEQGLISIVDRFPVITSDISNTAAGQNITDKVRYKIDSEDPSATEEPEKNREIGVTLSVTPTLLPDGTVRMKLRPRVAKIVELIQGRTSNVFPRVSESTVEAISRIPAGQSLFLGGFYDYSNSDGSNKVPILGTIPLVGKLFSSDTKKLEQVSLVFVITPRVYDASSTGAISETNWHVREYSGMQPEDIGDASLLLPKADWPNSSPHDKNPVRSTQTSASPAGSKPSWVKRLFSKKNTEVE